MIIGADVVYDSLLDRVVMCWPHIARNTIDKYKKYMIRPGFFAEAKKDVEALHMSRSKTQFEKLADLMISRWIQLGEEDVAKVFKREYLSPPYDNWSVTSSGVRGVLPNNNPMESWHRDIKRDFGKNAADMLLQQVQ